MCSRVKRPSVISERCTSLIRGNKFVKRSTTAIPTSQEPLSRTGGPVAQARQDVGRLLALRRFDGGHLHASITIDVFGRIPHIKRRAAPGAGSPAPVTITAASRHSPNNSLKRSLSASRCSTSTLVSAERPRSPKERGIRREDRRRVEAAYNPMSAASCCPSPRGGSRRKPGPPPGCRVDFTMPTGSVMTGTPSFG